MTPTTWPSRIKMTSESFGTRCDVSWHKLIWCSYAVQDALLDACSVVGVHLALQQLYATLSQRLQQYQQTQGQVGWRLVEAALFRYLNYFSWKFVSSTWSSIRSVARKVDWSENSVLPQIFALLPQLPQQREVLYTATLVVGRYCCVHMLWLVYWPMQDMRIGWKFIRNICSTCSRLLFKVSSRRKLHRLLHCLSIMSVTRVHNI